MDNPYRERFFAAVGELVLTWSLLESAVDASVHIIHQKVGGHEIEEQVPWALAKKLKFLRRCFRQIHRLSPQSETAVALFLEVGSASDLRHDIVHGVVRAFPVDDGPHTFGVLSRGDLRPKIHEFVISTPAIKTAAKRAAALTFRSSNIAEWLVAEFLADLPDNPGGKVAG